MRRLRTLGARLLGSHLAVLVATGITVIVVARLVAPTFYSAHVESMSHMMGGMTAVMEAELEAGFEEAFWQAMAVSMSVGIVVAVVASVVGSRRVIKPIDAVRRATRRLAGGNYRERVEEPLEEELAALAADVNHLAEALEHTEARRLRLLSEVSHELRTPLTTIDGYMEAILDGVLEPTPDIMGSVAHEASRLKRLAADIALLSRAEEETLPLERQAVDLVGLVEAVVTRLRPQYEEGGVDLRFTGSDPVVVTGDPDRLTQVVTNLVGNALSYTPAGGEVAVAVSADGPGAIVEVADTGRGVAAEDRERIFERFYRADRTAPGGMGVGLAIARSIARLHGGDVTVASEGPGRGSVFALTLPIDG